MRVLRRHIGKRIRCPHAECEQRFTLRAPTAEALLPVLMHHPPPADAPLVRDEAVHFEDLQALLRPGPLVRHQAVAEAEAATGQAHRETSARRRPWFALAALVSAGVFAFWAPVRRCPECDGVGQFPGQVLYRRGAGSLEPVGAEPPVPCGQCSGTGRLTPYQLLYDWIADE